MGFTVLLRLAPGAKTAEKVRPVTLRDFKLDERGFQDILFRTVDRLIPDDELLLIMQSRRWQEEPDLMGLDREGRLYIFELKAWEARSENLLQVLRYGQLFGSANYQELDDLFRKFDSSGKSLSETHKARFETELPEDRFNCDQRFVVVTNGVDYKTREAVRYWRLRRLEVRPWIYRVFRDSDDAMLVEITPFSVDDNPYEDVTEGYYVLNTNSRNSIKDHEDMLQNGKAAAYFAPPKFRISGCRRAMLSSSTSRVWESWQPARLRLARSRSATTTMIQRTRTRSIS